MKVTDYKNNWQILLFSKRTKNIKYKLALLLFRKINKNIINLYFHNHNINKEDLSAMICPNIISYDLSKNLLSS